MFRIFALQLWKILGHDQAIEDAPWPQCDAAALVQDKIQLMVQVNGKLRDKITVNADADDEQVKQQALASDRIKQYVADQTIKKIIVVKGRLINVVI